MKQQTLADDVRHVLTVDPAAEATTVAIAPLRVSELAQVVVRHYPGLGVEDAVRLFITEEAVEATDVTVARAVTEPDTTTPTRALRARPASSLPRPRVSRSPQMACS